jgi:hypothetical protein
MLKVKLNLKTKEQDIPIKIGDPLTKRYYHGGTKEYKVSRFRPIIEHNKHDILVYGVSDSDLVERYLFRMSSYHMHLRTGAFTHKKD